MGPCDCVSTSPTTAPRSTAGPGDDLPLTREDVVRALVDALDETAVVVSELLGNAVRHAQPLDDGRLLLRWQVRGGVVDVEVTDGGSRHEVRPLRPTEMSVHGRGLRIVRHLAHEWGVVEDAHGNRTVWACLGGPSRRRRRA